MEKRELKDSVVSALFENREEADRAVDALAAAQVAPDEVSVITNMKDYNKEEIKEIVGDPLHHESIFRAKIGGLVGFLLGGTLAAVGLMTGEYRLQALPMVLVIASAVGFLGAVIQAGFYENAWTSVDEAIREGKVLLSLRSRDHDRAKRAEGVLRACHAHEIHRF